MKRLIRFLCLVFPFLVVPGLEAKVWEDWSAEDIPHPESPFGGFGGGPAQGVIFPSLGDFNKYLEDNDFKEICAVGRSGGTSRWSLNKNLQIGLCGGGFYGGSSTTKGDKIKEVILEGGGGVFLAAYRIPRNRVAAVIGLGLGGFGGEIETITTARDGKEVEYKRFSFGGPMVQLFLEGAYYAAPILGVGINVSYILAKTQEVDRGGEDAVEVDEVDFSGIMITFGPRFHF